VTRAEAEEIDEERAVELWRGRLNPLRKILDPLGKGLDLLDRLLG
jgi:hypothetical protein